MTLRRLLVVVVALACGRASAFPIYARKYETGCQTCHVAVPKLNSFGIAFRNNGYQWPAGESELTKDKPVVLAAEANKESFPDSIWPSWLPRTPPVAFLLVSELEASPDRKALFGPEGVGADLEIGIGTAIAEDIAARADVTMVVNAETGTLEVGLEQAFLQFHNLDPWHHLDLRVGKLWPELFSFPPQALGGDFWLYNRSIGASSWVLAGRQGAELRGIFAAGRLRAVAGTAGSTGDFGKSFDAWGRVGYKVGGLRYDGVDESSEEPAKSSDPSRPWRDTSVQFGAFAYKGFSVTPGGLDEAGVELGPIRDDFVHVGGDVNIWLGDANLVGALLIGQHGRPVAGAESRTIHRVSLQLDYVVFPWLIPSLRYELADDARLLEFSADAPRWHLMPGLNALIRANVRAYLFAEVIGNEQGGADFHKLTLGILAAF